MSRVARIEGVAEELVLARYDGKHFTFASPRAFAPGQPMAAQLTLAAGAPEVRVDLKAIGSVKRADGGFEVRARGTTLTRAARSALAAAFGLTEA
jgi:hypothetical protein